MKSKKRSSSNKKTDGRQSERLLDLCSDFELFTDYENEPYASFYKNDHFETWSIKSPALKAVIESRFYEKSNLAPSSIALTEAINSLRARAIYCGVKMEVFLRIGSTNGNIYFDLCDSRWRVVEITSGGWTILESPPIKFRRTRAMLASPDPIRISSEEAILNLRTLLNIATEDDFKLVLSVLLSAFLPKGPFPILGVSGEQGSSKSTFIKVLRNIIDPNASPLRSEPKNEDDLMVSAKNNFVLTVDNIDYIPPWLSNAFCKIATGGALSKREHYSNDDEVLLSAVRPIYLNGIEDFITRGDLASRAIVLHLPAIPALNREREETFWQRFEDFRPGILGFLFSALSIGLANKDTFQLSSNERMADCWHWISACETYFGFERGSSLACFVKNQKSSEDTVLESSALFPHLDKLAENYWEGNATSLLTEIRESEYSYDIKRSLPRSPRALTNSLRRLAPALRSAGIVISLGERSASIRKITISRGPVNSVTSVTKSYPIQRPNSDDANDVHDATSGLLQMSSSVKVELIL